MATSYLITGGAGNLACQLTHELARDGSSITLFDIAARPVSETAPGCQYVQGDLTDGERVRATVRRVNPEVIVHLASLLSGSSEQDRRLAWQVNMDGTFHLLEQAVEQGVPKFFFPSSTASYGGNLPQRVSEDQPQWPAGLYGVTKLAVERLGVYYHCKHGMDFRSIRIPVVVSEFAPAAAASAYASHAFVEAVRQGRFTLVVRPTSRPSLVYVKDIIRGIVQLIDAPAERLSRRVYNIQSLSPTAGDLARAISERLPAAELSFDIDPQVADLIDSWPSEYDDASARRDWHWQPQYDLETMADDFIEHLQRRFGDAR